MNWGKSLQEQAVFEQTHLPALGGQQAGLLCQRDQFWLQDAGSNSLDLGHR